MDDSTETPNTIPRDNSLWPFFAAALRKNGGELFISHEELGEACVAGEIAYERHEDGATYRLVEATEDAS